MQGRQQDQQWLAERLEAECARLHAVAYRLLGSTAEAEDAVQEAWLRLARTSGKGIDELGACLTTVVSRASSNALRSRRVRRQDALDQVRLPDPVLAAPERMGQSRRR